MRSTLAKSSLSQQIARQLTREVRSRYAAGDRFPSESAMARRFGVSVITVREALGILAEQGLITRRHGSGTYVADYHSRASVALLCKLDLIHPQASFFYRIVSQQVVASLRAAGIKARVFGGNQGPGDYALGEIPESFLEALRRYQVRGILALAAPDPEQLRRLAQREKLPLVGDDESFPWHVTFDRAKMIRQGVTLLKEAGRRRIAMMTWGDPAAPEQVADVALFRQEMAQHGLTVCDPWVRAARINDRGGNGWTQMRALWDAMPEKPDGLLICDDLLYRDACLAILAMGIRVPEQLTVLSHANHGSGILCPFPTTLLEFDARAYALAMVELLRQRMNQPHDDPAQARTLPLRIASSISPDHASEAFACPTLTMSPLAESASVFLDARPAEEVGPLSLKER